MRPDISFRLADKTYHLDVTVTQPLAASHGARADTPGACAEAAAKKKHAKYDPVTQPGHVFVPIVFETYGTMADESIEHLTKLAVALGKRHGLPPHRSIPMFFQRLSAVLQTAVADVLVRTEAIPDELVEDAVLAFE
jgi:hypothetical protein